MNTNEIKAFLVLIILFTLLTASCVAFRPGWKNVNTVIESVDTAMLFQRAQNIENTAANRKQVLELIDAYKAVVNADAGNYAALWRVGNFYILMGAAYSENKKEKKFNYREAIKYCEKAMYLNPLFKHQVDNGIDVWDAVSKLDINYIDAMGYWYTARFYYFKECLGKTGKLFNTKIVIQNNLVIAHIDSLNPNWAGGGNYFSRAIYLIAVPEKFGGSKTKAAEEFEKAILAGPDYLVNRWGRAKYLYSLNGNKKGYIDDLKWVLGQNPHTSGNPYPWNVYFQSQAAKMLSEADNIFK